MCSGIRRPRYLKLARSVVRSSRALHLRMVRRLFDVVVEASELGPGIRAVRALTWLRARSICVGILSQLLGFP